MKRRKSEKEQKLADDARLVRAWHRWHREQLEEALAGMHADVMGRLMAELKDLHSACKLVDFINSQDWGAVDANTRLIALHEINAAITRLRERMSPKEPISAPLPGEPPNTFRMIQNIVTKVPCHRRRKPTQGSCLGRKRTCHE